MLPARCPGSRLPLLMAAPSAPRCAGAPGRSGSLRGSAARPCSGQPYGLGLDAPPASRVPPRLRRGGGGGFAPRSCTGAGAPQIAGAICAWRLPPAPRQPGWGQVRLGGLRSACCLARRVAAAPVHANMSEHSKNVAHAIVMLDMSTSSQPTSPAFEAKVLILGNGRRRQVDTGCSELTFTFNSLGPTKAKSKLVNVQMTRDGQGAHRLTLETADNPAGLTDLEHHLNVMLDQQLQALGCLPSTGYALIHGLWSSHEGVAVDGIWFNPSLARPVELSPRKPLPQAFHNWLGERRTTFQRWLTGPPTCWSWSIVDGLDTKGTAANTARTQRSVHHTRLLAALIDSAKTGSLHGLEDIAQAGIQPSPELLRASAQTSQLEQMFHLSRAQSDTPNWWLYDAHASALIEQIVQRLRLAQYLAFSNNALSQVTAD